MSCLLRCALFLFLSSFSFAATPPVQLLLPSRTLQPESTFELRFATEMVSPAEVGQRATISPIILAPAVPGHFVWLSTRSGSFTPEGILPLGTKFTITLRPGTKDAAGTPVTAKLREIAETPPFQVKGEHALTYTSSENATVMPRFLFLFNANVNAAAAAKFCRFVNAAGARIDARVEQADDQTKRDRAFPIYRSDDRSLAVWGEKITLPAPSDTGEEEEIAPDPKKAPAPRGNVLLIAPVKPLPPGAGWRLVLETGLPATDPKLTLRARKELLIGVVQPFAATEVKAESNRVAGRRLILDFNKKLGDEVTAESLGRWIEVQPAVANLKPVVEETSISYQGDFALGVRYRVTIAAGLPSREPIATAARLNREVMFEQIAPRLYFPEFSSHQQTRGSRQVRIVSVNVPRLRMAAKLFTGDAIPVALKAYDKYEDYSDAERGPDETYSRVQAEDLPGKDIWAREFTPGGEVDHQNVLTLDWNEIIGQNVSGVVLLTAESLDPMTPDKKRVGTQTLLQLTDLGAVWKRDREHTSLHIFSLATGKGLPAVRLRLLDREGQEVAQATTGSAGEAELPQADDARWIFAATETDAHVIPIASSESEIPLYRLGVAQESNDAGDGGRDADSVFVFTERGVYKPGDTVYVKGYGQDSRSDQPRVPAGKPITLTVTDAKGREIFTKALELSEFGSFDGEIVLPQGTLGRYRMQVTGEEGDGLGGSCSFQVQEYKPNAFEMEIPAPPETFGNTQLSLPITAKYLMGKPLSQAKLTWSLVGRDDTFAPAGLEAYGFCNTITDFRLNRALDRVSQFNAQGDAAVDQNGIAQVATALPVNAKAPQPRAAKLLCEVTDLNQQTVSEARAFVQHSSEFYFGLKRFDGVVKEGAPLPIELIAVRPDGKPLERPVAAMIRLTRITWQTNRFAAAGETAEFESKPQLEVLWERELPTVPGAGADRKPASATLADAVADKPGDYLLEAIGKDAGGHEVLTSLSFDVSGAAETDWNYRNPYVIDLIPDKDSYEPGQTATLLVKTPIAGDALVTVERDRVLRSFVVPLAGNAPTVQVPIAATDGPNVFVSVMLLRGANDSPRKVKAPEYRIGYADLRVARPKDKLTVEVRPAKRASLPKDNVQIDAEVKDHNGQPSPNSEVTLYAVDEGVLSLTGYKTPDPLAFFQQPRGLSVSTSLTLETLLREDAAELDFANKGYLVGDGKGGAGLLDGLRKNFIACPFWTGTGRTDAQGRLQVEFKAPDSLTRYRVIAVAVTKLSQFGVGESSFEVNKPIIVESAIPAFANVGDKITLRAVVHNTTDFGGKAELLLELDETAQAGKKNEQFSLGAHESKAIDLPIEVVALGEGKWRWAVKFVATDGTAELRDEVQATIKVAHPAPLIRQVQTGRVEGETGELLRITDPQIAEGTGEVTVSLTNTRVGELGEAVRQLLEYPYGCVEQTTSSLLPWLTVRDLRSTLPELAKSDEEIAEAINGGVRLLLTMQTSGGGLSYWPGGNEPMLWGSAYGALALTLAQKQGYTVPEAEYKRLLKYLSDQLRGTANDATGYGLSDRCLTVYSLAVAGVSEPAYHDLLFQKRGQLSAEDRALVALALIESKGAKQMIDQLLAGPATDEAYVEQWFGSVVRENALHLFAWSLHQPRSPRVDELALELFARRANGHWSTTQGNAWSLLALSSYLRNVENGSRVAAGTIAWGGAKKTFALSPSAPLARHVFPLEPATVVAPLTIAKTGDQVFSEVTVSARSKLVEQPRQDQGYGLARRYAKIGDDGKLAPAENLRVGDRVLVTLDVEARRRATYLALQDPLPAVLAPINPVFKSQETLAGESLGTAWVSDYHELRSDRAVFFVDLLQPGRYTLRYLARVVCAGDVIAPSAKIEEMYHPERFGTTETRRFQASPLP